MRKIIPLKSLQVQFMRDPAETKKTNNKNHRQYISIFHLIKLKFIFFIPYYIKLYQL